MANNGSDMINIEVKTSKSRIYRMQVHKQISVAVLREQIAAATNVPLNGFDLVYAGREVKDGHALSFYNVEDGDTIHHVTWKPLNPARLIPLMVEERDSFLLGSPTRACDVELMNRITTLTNSHTFSLSNNSNASASNEVSDTMTRLRCELDRLGMLSQTNATGSQSASLRNPLLQVNSMPESLTSLYLATCSLVNNLHSRMHTLACEIQMQQPIAYSTRLQEIKRSVRKLGAELQDVGEVLLDLGRITSAFQINSINTRLGVKLLDGLPVNVGNKYQPISHQMTIESLMELYVAATPLLNNILVAVQTLVRESRKQLRVSEYANGSNIRKLAQTLGTQLEDVGEVLVELGQIASTLINPC